MLQYPNFEIIFSLADEQDPAHSIVTELISLFPSVEAKVIVSKRRDDWNPKVENLVASYAEAKHNWILISDSNVRVEADYLTSLASQLDANVGVMTSAISGRNADSLSAKLEATYLNTFYARWMLLADNFGYPFVIGKSMVFQKKMADRFGGLKTLGIYLAEDYMTGVAMKHLGMKIVLSRKPVIQHLSKINFKSFWARHLRWGRMRKAHAPFVFLTEPFASSLGSIIFAAPFLSFYAPGLVFKFLCFHFFSWGLCDFILAKKMDPKTNFTFLFSWILRELSAFPMWIHILMGNSVSWRGKNVSLEAWGVISPGRRA
ncbi:MAG: putative Ceramide glucosyltransferase [Bacteriovoracaceae bacterium]|nr:putative Ceramide glucosyltransferase [Bacteriovoracaceae bacterium]